MLSFWGARVRVVTNVVNPRCFSCGFLLRCYERRQSEGFFAEVPVEGLCWASFFAELLLKGSSPVEWCNRFVSFGLGYALSWSGVSSCWVGCGVSRDLVRMSRLR